MDREKNNRTPQVKICGLTSAREALACAELGVDAVGFIFYPQSPRHLRPGRAKQIARKLPASLPTVGVFVDASFDVIMQTADAALLRGVQLHGRETPHLVDRLRKEGLLVIKALFTTRSPHFSRAADYAAAAFLVECGAGKLPGGNAASWDYASAKALGATRPFILAGGLTAENITEAVCASRPDAVDVSSGVEISPGKKDLSKIASLLSALERAGACQTPRRIFHGQRAT